MTLKRVAVLTILTATTPLWARPEVDNKRPGANANRNAPVARAEAGRQAQGGVRPRQVFPKPNSGDIHAPANGTGRLIVKFRDDVKARAFGDKTVISLNASDLTASQDVIARMGADVNPAIRISGEKISDIEFRAAAISGNAQPDLAGFIYVSKPGATPNEMVATARALNALPEVEFVDWELNYVLTGGDLSCGDMGAGDCFECHDNLFCDNLACCTLVCELDPFCCDENANFPGRGMPHWDSLCVSNARAICGGIDNVCANPFAGGCFESHLGPGCNNGVCCGVVCEVQPFCCDVVWDAACAQIAGTLPDCLAGGNVTGSFTDAQGYLRPGGYLLNFGQVPGHILPGLGVDTCEDDPNIPLGFAGFGGEGWDLNGLWNFGNLLVDLGTPGPNLTRGRTIKVGVIEHTALVDWQDPSRTHEDLRGKVIAEPHQTLVMDINADPSSPISGNHGTACLGIIGAKDDGTKGHSPAALAQGGDEVGIVGVAPEAELYFFPIVSVEEGGRLLNAIANALSIFGPGDVLSFSIGPGGSQTLASTQANWTMIRLASDLGVTCCIAAGNSCANIDGVGQFQNTDSGVCIVGACYPGFRYFRLGFSNHCVSCQGASVIHVSAWGTAVASLAYGDMAFPGGDHYRKYTNSFGGTSAACPQIAGLIANLQGLAKQFYGIPLMPTQIRGLAAAAGVRQAATEPPPGPCGSPCFGDWCPDRPPHRITTGANRVCYPDPPGDGIAVVSATIFDGNPLIDDITILRGEYVYGNKFSIRSVDNNFFVMRSLFTERDETPSIPGPAHSATYLGTGQIADVLVTAHTDSIVNAMSVSTSMLATGVLSFQFVELFDWNQGKWTFIGFNQMANNAAGPVNGTFNVAGAQRFINPTDRKVLIRTYVLAIGNNAPVGSSQVSETPQYILRIDQVALLPGLGFGGPGIFIPPGP